MFNYMGTDFKISICLNWTTKTYTHSGSGWINPDKKYLGI